MQLFGPLFPVEPTHRQASDATHYPQQRPHADIDSVGLENFDGKPSPSAPNSPCLRTSEQVLGPATGQASGPSKGESSRNIKLAVKEKPERKVAKPQGVSKRQPAKTTRGKGRKI